MRGGRRRDMNRRRLDVGEHVKRYEQKVTG